MGSNDEFGPDTDRIRAWLEKRATYTKDARVLDPPRAEAPAVEPSPEGTSDRCADVTSPQNPAGAHRSGDGNSAGRSILAALGVDTAPEPQAAATVAGPDGNDVGRSVVDALRADMPVAAPAPPQAAAPAKAAPAPRTAPAPRPAARFAYEARASKAPAPRAVPPEIRVGRWTEPVDNLTSHHASTDVDFPARRGGRRVLALLMLVVVVATGVASYLAWREPTTATTGIAATLGVLTLVVWAVRASSTTTQLSIRRGQLTVRRGGRTEVVDIAGGFTPVAIIGRPGQRRWKVLIERGDQPLVTITPAMVDPHWFTTALYRIRPDLRPEAQALRAAAEEYDDASVGQAS